MTAVPAPLQTDLALLLALLNQPGGLRAARAFDAVRPLLSPPPAPAAFDTGMDRLIARRYVTAAETTLTVTPAGHLFLGSLAEYAAARGQPARLAFDRLTAPGWSQLAAQIAALPARYRGRRGDHAVYVILLDRAVSAVRRFPAANPAWQPHQPCLYVGMTSRPPLARFREHQSGRKSSRYVRRFGLCLLPELFHHLNPLDRSGAAALEQDLAADLRAQGCAVMGVYPATP